MTATYALDDGIATITMDDGKANALSLEMIAAIDDALDRAKADNAGAVILTGRPDRFCAGFDLRVMMSGPENAMALLRKGGELLLRLYELPLPLVIAASGHALAGGALVVLTGDHRIAADGAYKLGLNEVAIGLPVPVLAMELARDRIVKTELVRATLFAHIYTPTTAVPAGYLDQVVPPAELAATARAEAKRLAGLSKPAFIGTKQRMRRQTIEYIRRESENDFKQALQR